MQLVGWVEGHKPLIEIELQGSKRPLTVLVDTGFKGDLMLPLVTIKRLRLRRVGEDSYMSASGQRTYTSLYLGSLKWFGRTRRVGVLATSGTQRLIGMQLLYQFQLLLAPSQGRLIISTSPRTG